MQKGNSISNAIVIDAPDAITGVTMEQGYIDQIIESLDCNIESVDQSLVVENGRQFDQIILKLDDGSEKILFFDISSFFGKI